MKRTYSKRLLAVNESRLALFLFVLVMLTNRCVEPFQADVPPGKMGILVVEGYINAGPGESIIRLSRATSLSGSQQTVEETGSIVSIVSIENETYELIESVDGVYASGELNLPLNKEYRIQIRLKNGEEYRSEFLPVKITPIIDSVSWELDNSLDIYVNTHDPENATRYYQWQFEEDWQIRSPFRSVLMYEDDTVKTRPPEETALMYNCWKSSRSQGLILGSSENIVSDKINFRLKRLPLGAEQTSIKYSILVRQHTLSEEDYNFLKLMEKNTTEVGSFSDPMPSELYGNVEGITQPGEKIIGYVGVYTTETKRLFILNSQLPSVPTGNTCQTREVEQTDKETINELKEHYIPTRTYLDLTGTAWMTLTERSCLDCRMYGSSVKPDFW
jgi:hypothetical protein